ncbi:DUF397 domain-containing protein [Streptomyces sp. NPDC059378]|uniref:DUF397 domain-containing protein n=1 Tax=Streptomyces sp. NPDC059378 TaxID=3346815 RepID=UPI0036A2DD16
MPEKPNWHTSTYTTQDSCVEVADNDPDVVMVRDTKDRGNGIICSPPSVWTTFVSYVKQQ